MKIKEMPWFNRPGFKLTREGVDHLDNAELLSIIFFTNNNEDDALELSNKILRKYNLNKLEDAGYNELVSLVCNEKRAEYKDFIKVMKLLSLIELSKRYNKLVSGGFNRTPITNAKDVYNIFKDKLRNFKKERLYALLLDTKNVVIKEVLVSEGTLNSSLIHPREVFKEAIKESAFSVMLVHNHPSGNPEPSEEDMEMTKNIIEAGKTLNILVLDHVIIGKNRFWNWLDTQS